MVFIAHKEMDKDMPEGEIDIERPGTFWRKIYLAVIINTVLVIAALWLFSLYFS